METGQHESPRYVIHCLRMLQLHYYHNPHSTVRVALGAFHINGLGYDLVDLFALSARYPPKFPPLARDHNKIDSQISHLQRFLLGQIPA